MIRTACTIFLRLVNTETGTTENQRPSLPRLYFAEPYPFSVFRQHAPLLYNIRYLLDILVFDLSLFNVFFSSLELIVNNWDNFFN